MKKKIIIIAVAALVIAGGAYKTVLAKPKEKAPEPKVHGTVYVLPEGVPGQPGRRPVRQAVRSRSSSST